MRRPPITVLPLLLLTIPLAARAATAKGSLDACDASGDSPTQRLLAKAQTDLHSGDADEVRKAVATVRKDAADDPYLLLRAGSLLSALSDKKGADDVYKEAVAAAKRGGGDANIGKLYEAAALIRLGDPKKGVALLDEVRAQKNALHTYACRYIAAAQALADTGDVKRSVELLKAVREAYPKARSIHNALVDVTLKAQNWKEADDAITSAMDTFPDGVEFVVRRVNRLKMEGKRDEALALVEQQLLKGVDDPALLGEFLGLISADPVARKLENHWLELAKAHPELATMSMAVGVDYHYLHDYAKSSEWLKKTGKLIEKEPRVAMYMAMNEFHMGHQKEAEKYIDEAAHAGRPDPDIYYCRAVIEVRQDAAASMHDLSRYMSLTTGRADVEPQKQQRVQQTIDLLQGCLKQKDSHACVENEVVVQAKALAFREHYPGEKKDDKSAPAATIPGPEETRTKGNGMQKGSGPMNQKGAGPGQNHKGPGMTGGPTGDHKGPASNQGNPPNQGNPANSNSQSTSPPSHP